MRCETCGDLGIVTVNWADVDPDYAVCVCPVGLRLRVTTNAHRPTVPLWQVWAAREQVDPARIVMLEEVLTSEELAAGGFVQPASLAETEIIAAGKTRRGKL